MACGVVDTLLLTPESSFRELCDRISMWKAVVLTLCSLAFGHGSVVSDFQFPWAHCGGFGALKPFDALEKEILIQDPQPDQFGWWSNDSAARQELQAAKMDPPLGVSNPESGPSHRHRSSRASATFTPTAAGLRPEEGQGSALSPEMCDMIAQSISKGIDAVLIQRGILAPLPKAEPNLQTLQPMGHSDREYILEPHSPSPLRHTDMSLMGEEDMADYNLSEDERIIPDKPAAMGLFRHDLFKTLLYKAKTTANMGVLIGNKSLRSS